MTWKTNKKPVKVLRVTVTEEDDETVMTYNEDKTVEKLSLQELSENQVAIQQYGSEAQGRLRIILEKNETFNRFDHIVYNGNVYEIDTEITQYRRFRVVGAKWHSKDLTSV